MTRQLFIVGDVHGEYELLLSLLQHWDSERQQLVFLGDLADRGPAGRDCWQLAKTLVEEAGAVCLMGNHEDIFLTWLADPLNCQDWYLRNGGQTTLESLLGQGILDQLSPEQLAASIRKIYPDLLAFLENLPLYYETEAVICVHAGLDLDLEDWYQTSKRDFLWLRETFYQSDKRLDKLIVHGHTPTIDIRQDRSQSGILIGTGKINIDGGAVYGGSLHGLVLEGQTLVADHQIFSKKV